jgi:hypothetical protein
MKFTLQELREVEHLLRNEMMALDDDIYEERENGNQIAVENLTDRLCVVRNAYQHLQLKEQLLKEEIDLLLDITRTKLVNVNNDFYNIVDSDGMATYFKYINKTFKAIEEKLKEELEA